MSLSYYLALSRLSVAGGRWSLLCPARISINLGEILGFFNSFSPLLFMRLPPENIEHPVFLAIGLMSGTSLDAIDVALLQTDGHALVKPCAFRSYPYGAVFRERMQACFGPPESKDPRLLAGMAREVTMLHADAVEQFLMDTGTRRGDVDLVGFHGQTTWHAPEKGQTVQLGDGGFLADEVGIPVVADFRTADVQAGGQGAPLVPLYHRALAARWEKPCALINIGGIANITWIGGAANDQILACDTGPGNALINDWILRRTDLPYDPDGAYAAKGTFDEAHVARFLQDPYFALPPPKSLDRDHFSAYRPSDKMSIEDGAATLTVMTASSIALAVERLPEKPRCLWLTGGGRHNRTLVAWIEKLAGVPVASVDIQHWDGDAQEAEAFAYLAVRSVLRLPLSLPGTTGVKQPALGGVLFEPRTHRHRRKGAA